MEIRRVVEMGDAVAAERLFDGAARPEATARFLHEEGHHLLVAYLDGKPVGMVSGVETTHPDKGTEMFLYELSVDPAHRRRGVGGSLVRALRELAQQRGCYGMWVGTEHDNAAALATYRAAGATDEEDFVSLTWSFRNGTATTETAR
ncbi:GNAT family N-acetyltransferase [Streptomyces sp. 796.1]|uniref:GNAT family N-acetyltransferase n=1 Tax=Streptomyces sp. 796.1 TaxID=3163029 RepID=UPI0039C91599